MKNTSKRASVRIESQQRWNHPAHGRPHPCRIHARLTHRADRQALDEALQRQCTRPQLIVRHLRTLRLRVRPHPGEKMPATFLVGGGQRLRNGGVARGLGAHLQEQRGIHQRDVTALPAGEQLADALLPVGLLRQAVDAAALVVELPLALATGAGSGAQRAIGTGVIGGMLSGTFLGLFFIPLFFVAIRRLVGGRAQAAA